MKFYSPRRKRGARSPRRERGASAVEYALLIAGIAVVLVLAIYSLGPVVEAMYDTCDDIAARDSSTATCA